MPATRAASQGWAAARRSASRLTLSPRGGSIALVTTTPDPVKATGGPVVEADQVGSSILVLLVEDDAQDCARIRTQLANASRDFEIVETDRVEDALQLLKASNFDIMLLDLSLPEGHGLDVLKRAQVAASAVPIIVMAEKQDDKLASKAVRAGAQDHLVKGKFDSLQLVHTILQALERHRMLVELHAARRKQQHLASHDDLTGLYSRGAFEDNLRRILHYAKRYEKLVGLFFLDLDGFKAINDGIGHAAGDEVLRTVAQRLSGWLRRSDMAARVGGDEFVLVLQSLPGADVAAKAAERLLVLVGQTFQVGGQTLGLTTSIGIAIYPDDATDAENLLRNADIAMYTAKSKGKNQYEFFSKGLSLEVSRKLRMESRLREALERDEFILHYQPILEATGALVGAEALVRWEDPELGLLAPGDFISVAEETGVILPMGEWVLHTACRQWKELHDAGLVNGTVAVNLSAQQFRDPGLVQLVVSVLGDTGLSPPLLQLELTETTVMQDEEVPVAKLRELHSMGIELALDDFGTGYSSLSRLHSFPFDRIKMDHSFVKGLPHNPDSLALTSVIIGMAHNLGLRLTAEGVETQEQYEVLAEQGCEEFQGFLFSRPLPLEEFALWLEARARR